MNIKKHLDDLKTYCEHLEVENARLEAEAFAKERDMPLHCKDCKHFIRHYVKDLHYLKGYGYAPLRTGHCTEKIRKKNNEFHENDLACELFEIEVKKHE